MERRIYCDFGMRTKNSDLSSMRYISANANFTVCIPINVDDTVHAYIHLQFYFALIKATKISMKLIIQLYLDQLSFDEIINRTKLQQADHIHNATVECKYMREKCE